jgi:hypothetical protein
MREQTITSSESKRKKFQSLILQGIKPHRAKECMVYGDQKQVKISS